MKGQSESVPTVVTVDAQELAYALVELGDAKRAMRQKVYAVTMDRIDSVARRIRFMLDVAGADEKGERVKT